MQEKNIIILLSVFFLFTGILVATSVIYDSDFNFNKAELSITDQNITEKLFYTPDQDYHTLYRNFLDLIFTEKTNYPNYIEIKNVKCAEGTAYVNDNIGNCDFFPKSEDSCMPFTEKNEYGCTFGETTGFKTDNNYNVEANYLLHPENLFLIKGSYYIKFIAYSKNKHSYLDKTNLIISSNAITDSEYYPRNDVIVYILFNNKIENHNIIEQKDFEFDSSFFQHLLIILYSLFPLILILLIWFFFGREASNADIPKELSNYPKKRPGYEVAIAFNPPFSANKNMWGALLLELYTKKIIDFKKFEDQVYVKLLKNTTNDEIFNRFIKLFNKIKDLSKKEFFKEGYLNLKDAIDEYGEKTYNAYSNFSNALNNKQESFVKTTGNGILIVFIIISIASLLFIYPAMGTITVVSYALFIIQDLVFLLILIILFRKSALFAQFKKEYYTEYLHWQSFKNYLKNSFAMRESQHEAAVLWNEYLVYATAFGISKNVLKRLKDLKIIDETVYTNYSTINRLAVTSFVFSPPASKLSGSSSGGGGFSGASSGGIGGGGGGGR